MFRAYPGTGLTTTSMDSRTCRHVDSVSDVSPVLVGKFLCGDDECQVGYTHRDLVERYQPVRARLAMVPGPESHGNCPNEAALAYGGVLHNAQGIHVSHLPVVLG